MSDLSLSSVCDTGYHERCSLRDCECGCHMPPKIIEELTIQADSNRPGRPMEAPIKTFYVTFGQQYSREPHPMVTWAHPDGWLEIQVEKTVAYREAERAREIALSHLGRYWSGIYDFESLNDGYYPKGCLARIHRDSTIEVFQEFRPTQEEIHRDR